MISSFRVWRYALPLRAPVSLKPGSTMSVREGLLVELLDGEGESFWGEAAPLPGFSRESLEDARRHLEETMAKVSLVDPRRRSVASSAFPTGSPSVEFAVASAFGDLDDADRGRPGPRGSPERSVAVCGLLSGGREEILSDTAKLRKDGYEAVKLKVGRGSVEEDAALVGEVRKVLGGGVSLRLDANRAWSFEEAARFAGLIRDSGVEYIEEPLEDSSRLRELSEETGLPVALDESLSDGSLSEVEPWSMEDLSFARAFVLKPTVIGHSRTLSLASAARGFGADAIISSSYESGIGMMSLLRLAASTGKGAAGLDTYRRLAEDAIHPPLDLAKPRVEMNEIFGMEREVDYEKLERVS